MNYFDYNSTRLQDTTPEQTEFETLTFTGDETIEVSEDHTLTVDDIRNFIRSLDAQRSKLVEQSANVVRIRAA